MNNDRNSFEGSINPQNMLAFASVLRNKDILYGT